MTTMNQTATTPSTGTLKDNLIADRVLTERRQAAKAKGKAATTSATAEPPAVIIAAVAGNDIDTEASTEERKAAYAAPPNDDLRDYPGISATHSKFGYPEGSIEHPASRQRR